MRSVIKYDQIAAEAGLAVGYLPTIRTERIVLGAAW